jgi:hypothetical protein
MTKRNESIEHISPCAQRQVKISILTALRGDFSLRSVLRLFLSGDLRFAITPRAGSPLRYDRLSWSGLGFRVAVIPIWCRLGQSGGICDGHHRCDDLCFFFAQGYAGCKSNSGGRCRTVCPHYPERSAALIYR